MLTAEKLREVEAFVGQRLLTRGYRIGQTEDGPALMFLPNRSVVCSLNDYETVAGAKIGLAQEVIEYEQREGISTMDQRRVDPPAPEVAPVRDPSEAKLKADTFRAEAHLSLKRVAQNLNDSLSNRYNSDVASARDAVHLALVALGNGVAVSGGH